MYWRMDPDSVQSKTRSDKKILFLGYNSKDKMIVELQENIKEAGKNAGYDVTALYSDGSVDVQLGQLRNARRTGIKGIIVNLVTPESAPAILEAAGDMKVIFIAVVPVDTRILNKNAVYMGADQAQAGRLQGEWLASYFKERGKNEIKYILIQGINTPISLERTQAVLQALAENGIKAIPAVPPNIVRFDRAEAASSLLPVLKSGVKFDAIIANDDRMALGAIDALEAAGINPEKTVVVGIDATEAGVRAILDDKLEMTVYINRKKRATDVIKAMDNMLNGRPFDLGMEGLVSKDSPYAIIYPYKAVSRYQIPKDLYF
ncbi:MAG: hypothetical protein K0S22_413 [Oscillospiraceae bacterium]|nr:hypothetical protein [Oscillospiraceae bacterium]